MMIIEYTNGPNDHLTHFYFQNPTYVDSAIRAHRKKNYSIAATFGFIAFILFISDETLASGILLLVSLVYLTTEIPYKRKLIGTINAEASLRGEQNIKLELSNKGMTEHLDGVVSFVPWEKVKAINNRGQTYFIELPSNLWAIIPKQSMKLNGPTIEQVIEFLSDKGVENKTEQVSPYNSGQSLRD